MARAHPRHPRRQPIAIAAPMQLEHPLTHGTLAPKMLRVRVLGELGVEADGVAVGPLAGRPARNLLGWLALHPGIHARSTVAGTLWPGVLEESARRSLRNALSVLRAALGPAADTAVIATRETIGLAGGPETWVDVHEFDALTKQAKHQKALELCRGDLLLGLDDDWVLVARDEHRERRGRALAELAAAADAAGDHVAAVSHERRRVLLDPLDEPANRDLIGRLAGGGDRAGALVAYEAFAERLRRELGVAPSSQSRALAAELREDRRPVAPPATGPVHQAARVSGSQTARLPVRLAYARRRGPLVGRVAELAQLRAQWDAARSHAEARVALLAGEPGIGKTRLAAELAASVQADGAAVLYGRAEEDALYPYQPFVEALRESLEDASRDVAPEAAELALLLGPLDSARVAQVPEVSSGVSESGGGRLRLFDAVAEALTVVAGPRPLMVVLDDLHWADRPTMRLLAHVTARASGPPTLLLVTYRETEIGEGHPLTATLADLQRDTPVERLGLAGLAPDALADLVEQRLGHAPSSAVAQALREQTAGNPFFVEELLRALEQRELEALPYSRSRVPEGAAQAVAQRVGRLGSQAGALLTAGAMIGPEFDLEVAARVVGLPLDAALDSLDAAVRARIVGEVERAPGRYAFVHALARDALTGSLTAARRARLHGLIAEALADRAEADSEPHLKALAHHSLEAAPIGDPHRAVEIAERVAARHAAVYAYEDAAALLEGALLVLERAGGNPRREAGLRCQLGDALARAGASEAARAAFERAGELARSLGDGPLLARAALGAGGIGVTIFEPDRSVIASLEEAVNMIGDADDGVSARLLARLAIELGYEDDSGRREAASVKAVERARRHQDPGALAAALGARHVVLWGPEHARSRVECATEMLAAAEQAGAHEHQLQARNWRALDLLELGEGEELRAEVGAFAELATRARLPTYSWHVPMWRATLALMEGRLEEGMEDAQRAREMGDRVGDANAEMCHIHHRLTRLLVDERYDEVFSELYAGDLAYATDKQSSPAGPAYRLTLTWLLAANGKTQDARERFDALAGNRFAAIPRDVNWLAAIYSAANAAVLLGDVARAAELGELLEPFSDRMLIGARGCSFNGSTARTLARLAALVGEHDRADEWFALAAERDERVGAPVWLAHDLWRRGEHRLGLGDQAGADRLLEQAMELAHDLGLTRLVSTIRTTRAPE
jgi:DNA-binding SARP family transcriptional activator/tetratricopeptide (TPR) repeat protein